MRDTDLLEAHNPKRITVIRDGGEVEAWSHRNRPEKEGVYRCVMNDGSEMALELCHVTKFEESGPWIPSIWCWSLPGFTKSDKLGRPYWQPFWIREVKEFICDPLPPRDWTDADYLNWTSLTAGRDIH